MINPTQERAQHAQSSCLLLTMSSPPPPQNAGNAYNVICHRNSAECRFQTEQGWNVLDNIRGLSTNFPLHRDSFQVVLASTKSGKFVDSPRINEPAAMYTSHCAHNTHWWVCFRPSPVNQWFTNIHTQHDRDYTKPRFDGMPRACFKKWQCL